jgi:hypothetical protein
VNYPINLLKTYLQKEKESLVIADKALKKGGLEPDEEFSFKHSSRLCQIRIPELESAVAILEKHNPK